MITPSDVRVDLYTTIHKGIRSLLFETTTAAARLDPLQDASVDALVAQLERVVGFLEEHAEHEDREVLRALRAIAPDLEASLAAEHQRLDDLQHRVIVAGEALTVAGPATRAVRAAELCRLLNQLTAAHLAHMHREETEANGALWGALDDGELLAIQHRIVGSIAPARHDEWMSFALPAMSPAERLRMTGAPG